MPPEDQRYMKEALRLATKGQGKTSPNPMVGAVAVLAGNIVGRGYHEKAGGPHAEVNALREAGERARGATLYVTLEPCNHFGRTPPCTQAVVEAGISRVVAGMADPNPNVTGRGCQRLKELGLSVEVGVLEEECRELNQAFIKHTTTGLPYVTIKAAATLDGRIATRTGDSRWVSNELSRRFVHRLRHNLDSVLVGVETAVKDDPQLTARGYAALHCRQPVRIVLDSHLRLGMESKLVKTARDVPVWVACTESAPREKEFTLSEAGVTVIRVLSRNNRVDLADLLQQLGKRQMMSLLVEGGSRVLGTFIESGLGDDFHFFYAPKILGDEQGVPMIQSGERGRSTMSEALQVHSVRVRRFGQDVMISGRFHERLY